MPVSMASIQVSLNYTDLIVPYQKELLLSSSVQ